MPTASEISGVGTIRLYKRLTDVKSSDTLDWNPDFAILISYAAADSARYSQVYFGKSSLDFWIAKAENWLVLNGMRCLDYTSELEKSSKNDLSRRMDPEGRPDMCIWHPLPTSKFSSVNYKGTLRNLRCALAMLYSRIIISLILELTISLVGLEAADVMEALTGWRLLFCERAPAVALKGVRKLGGKTNLGEALVMVWRAEAKTNKDVQLLVRAPSSGAKPAWLSVSSESNIFPSACKRLPHSSICNGNNCLCL